MSQLNSSLDSLDGFLLSGTLDVTGLAASADSVAAAAVPPQPTTSSTLSALAAAEVRNPAQGCGLGCNAAELACAFARAWRSAPPAGQACECRTWAHSRSRPPRPCHVTLATQPGPPRTSPQRSTRTAPACSHDTTEAGEGHTHASQHTCERCAAGERSSLSHIGLGNALHPCRRRARRPRCRP